MKKLTTFIFFLIFFFKYIKYLARKVTKMAKIIVLIIINCIVIMNVQLNNYEPRIINTLLLIFAKALI